MKKLTCSLLSIIILFTFSCTIGLGSSVDTDPPSLSIDSNITNKIIRGDFALRGTFSDDGDIESISAVLKRTDKKGSNLSFSKKLSGSSGSWSIDIPALTDKITDGTYQADITIKDASARTTVQSTVFTIDNTSPIVILTRPSTTKDSTNSDTYGQKFTIEGQAADTNNISRIEIYLYKDEDCTEPVSDEPIVLKDVPLSIEMDAASYSSTDESYVFKGNTKDFSIEIPKDGIGEQFYCKIFAYDEKWCPTLKIFKIIIKVIWEIEAEP